MILDTNALSAFADEDSAVFAHIRNADELQVPVIVLGEFRFGIGLSRKRREYEAWLARGRTFWQVLPISEETADHYALIRRELKVAGSPVPANDVWIAALSRQHGVPVLSNDRHFDLINGIKRLSW